MKRLLMNIIILFALITGVFGTSVICHADGKTEMTPVYGKDIKDGSYTIEVTSSSSMFRIVKAELEVADGDMTAVITLNGTGYLKLFMGTGEEAQEAEEENYIPFVEDEEGAYTYTIPVEALNQEIECTAYSKRKEKWYDRQLVFLASSLPKDALLVELIDESDSDESENDETVKEIEPAKIENPNLTPVKMQVKDGEYTMEITLKGGSGRTTVTSPAHISVSENKAIASLEWSSPNFDYMIVNGKKYLPVNKEGNSVFEIPVLVLDQEIDVIADTVAMSKAHEIEYKLTFHSDTMESEKNMNSYVILLFGVALVVVVFVFVCYRNKKKKVQDA